tara:strand:+ start:2466 stop:2675 length:210 start_codon:yes stop_codon:yes gene_type:complete
MTYLYHNPNQLLTTADVGNILYHPQLSDVVKQKRVIYLINTNQLPMTRINRRYMIPHKKLVEWMEIKFK